MEDVAFQTSLYFIFEKLQRVIKNEEWRKMHYDKELHHTCSLINTNYIKARYIQ